MQISKQPRVIYGVDIGSTRFIPGGTPNFAWARVDPDAPHVIDVSSSIQELADEVISDLKHGTSVALGFEAPLFIPVPEKASNLCHGREKEGNRSCLAPAGLSVAALGIHDPRGYCAASQTVAPASTSKQMLELGRLSEPLPFSSVGRLSFPVRPMTKNIPEMQQLQRWRFSRLKEI